METVNFFEILADASMFERALDKAIAKTKEFAGDYNKMRRQVEADSAAVDTAAGNVRGPSSSSPRSGAAREAGTGFDLAASGGLAVGYGALAGLAALTGIAALIQNAVVNYANESAEILRNSQALDMNAQQLQTWMKIGEKAGIDQQSMTQDFGRFSKALAEGAPNLKATGVDLQQIGITSTNSGVAILQLADYFHTHNDQAEKAAIATALFGRSGTELIPILDQGSQAFKSYEAELQKTGALLSNTELVAGARAQVAIAQFGEAWDGAKNRLLAAVLPGFTLFFGQLTNLIEHNQGMFVSLGQTVDNVLLFITGLLAGITGTPLTDLSASANDAGSAYEGLGAGAQDASQGIDNTAASAKQAKDALAELQAQTQLQIDLIDEQIQALDDATAAYNDNIDAQKQALQDQYDQETYVTDSRRRAGEDLVSYERRLNQLNLQQKIHALDDEKSNFDRQQAAKKRALDDERSNLQRVLSQEMNSAKAAADAMAAAGALPFTTAANAARNFATNSLPASLSKAQQSVLRSAQTMGQEINDIFTDKDGKRGQAISALGTELGQDLIIGLIQGLFMPVKASPQASKNFRGDLQKIQDWLVDAIGSGGGDLTGLLSSLIGHSQGGIFSQEHLAWISEGNKTEAIIPVADSPRALSLMKAAGLDQLVLKQASPGRGGGDSIPPTIAVAFNGPVANELVASAVVTRLERKARQRGLLARGGFR